MAIPMKGSCFDGGNGILAASGTNIPHLEALAAPLRTHLPSRSDTRCSEQMRFLMRHMIVVRRVRVFRNQQLSADFDRFRLLATSEPEGIIIELPRGLSDGRVTNRFYPSTKGALIAIMMRISTSGGYG